MSAAKNKWDDILELLSIRETKDLHAAIRDWDDLEQLLNALKTPRFNLSPKLMDALKAFGDEAIRGLIALYEQSDFYGSTDQITGYIIRSFGTVAYPFLLEALHDPNRHVREKSANALRSYQGEEVIEKFLSLLDNEEPSIRKTAITYLSDHGSAEFRDKFIDKLTKDPESYVKATAARALGKIADTASMEALIEALRSSEMEWMFKKDIQRMLEENFTPTAITDAFSPLVYDPDGRVRRISVEVLNRFNARKMADTIISMLEDEEIDVRIAAVKALGRFNHKKAADALFRILDTEDVYIARDLRLSAGKVLSGFQDERAIIPLLKMVHDQEKYEDRIALNALLKFGKKLLEPVIYELMNTSSEQTIENGLEVLGRLKDARCLDAVLHHLQSENPYIRKQAFVAMERICQANKCMPTKSIIKPLLMDKKLGKDVAEFVEKRCGSDAMAMFKEEVG